MKTAMKNPWIIIGLVTIALFIGAFFLADQANEANNAGIEIKTQVKGSPDAVVVLEEYSDFQCPACAQAAPFVSEIVAQYEGELRFEYKHFPIERIHPYALQAAMAAEAAGQQGKFFEFHDLLFENQAQWSQSPTPNIFFIQYAEELGLDIDQFRRQSNASVLRDKVRAEQAEGVERGVTGTPGFFLNGERLIAADGRNLSYADIAARVAAAIDPEAAVAPESEDPEVVGEAQGETVRFGI
jgi:protein-disulfide isomerase